MSERADAHAHHIEYITCKKFRTFFRTLSPRFEQILDKNCAHFTEALLKYKVTPTKHELDGNNI